MDSSKYNDLNFYSDEELAEIEGDLAKVTTVPVNVTFEGEQKVYSLREMKEILRSSEKIALQECGCRIDHDNCSYPRDVCISLNDTAEEIVKNETYHPREVGLSKALEALRKSHDAGLVHMAYVFEGDEYPRSICSCCPCCCHTLGSLVRNKEHTQILTSKYVVSFDEEKCDSCGICVNRCAFQARKVNGTSIVYESDKCFGCGLCISSCPTRANKLVLRKHK